MLMLIQVTTLGKLFRRTCHDAFVTKQYNLLLVKRHHITELNWQNYTDSEQ